jgi:hypothetical protein
LKAKKRYLSLRELAKRWNCGGAEIARVVRSYEVFLLDIATGDERHPSAFRNFAAFLDVESNGDRILFSLDEIEAVERNHPNRLLKNGQRCTRKKLTTSSDAPQSTNSSEARVKAPLQTKKMALENSFSTAC